MRRIRRVRLGNRRVLQITEIRVYRHHSEAEGRRIRDRIFPGGERGRMPRGMAREARS